MMKHTRMARTERRSTLHHDDTAEQTAKLTAPLSLGLRTAGPADDSRREECHGPPGGRARGRVHGGGGREIAPRDWTRSSYANTRG